MNKVEHIANEIVRGLKVQNGIELEPENALIIARIAISVLEKVHERKVRTAFARWEPFKSEHKAGGKKWLDGLRTCLISRIAWSVPMVLAFLRKPKPMVARKNAHPRRT